MNPQMQGYWVLPQQWVVDVVQNCNYLMVQHQADQGEIAQLRQDHTYLAEHLDKARARETSWRKQIAMLKIELSRLRENIGGGRLNQINQEQKDMLRQLLSKLMPMPDNDWENRPPHNDPLTYIKYEMVMERKEYQRMVKLYADTCMLL